MAERAYTRESQHYSEQPGANHPDMEQVRGVELMWHEALSDPYLKQKVNVFFPHASLRLMIRAYADAERHGRSELAFRALLGQAWKVQKRSDGKPVLAGPHAPALHLSASHHAHLTCVVASPHPIGCDIEVIDSRSPLLWQDLLGPQRFQLATFLVTHIGEDLNTVGTRLWAAGECLKKGGAMFNAPLRFEAKKEGSWLLLKAGSFVIASCIALGEGVSKKLVFALCISSDIRSTGLWP